MAHTERIGLSEVKKTETMPIPALSQAGSHILTYLNETKPTVAGQIQPTFVNAETKFAAKVLPHLTLPYAPLVSEREKTKENEPVFTEMSLMLDLSRGGVYTPQFLKEVITHAAEHNYTHVALYTEFFPLDEYPDIANPETTGMLTKDDIQELARFADARGMQLYPCIQIFGHMEKLLQHPELSHLALPEDSSLHHHNSKKTLNPYLPEAYDFFDVLIRNAVEPYQIPGKRTRINIGCDEVAVGGDEEVFLHILNYGAERAAFYDAEPQAWADAAIKLPAEKIAAIHPSLQFVYWNYDALEVISDELRSAQEKGLNIVAAAGSTFSHNQLYPNWQQSIRNLDALSEASQRTNIPGLMLTNWHDDYAEAPLSTARGLIEYQGAKRFASGTNTSEAFSDRYKTFLEASRMHDLTSIVKPAKKPEILPNPFKSLYYEDPHTILFSGPLPERFGAQLEPVYDSVHSQISECEPADLLPLQYAEAVIGYGMTKDHGKDVRHAFSTAETGDTAALDTAIARNKQAQEQLLYVWMTHHALWHREKRPADWDELDKRYGTALEQLVTLGAHLSEAKQGHATPQHLTVFPQEIISGFPLGNREYRAINSDH